MITVVYAVYLFTTLVPINGLLWLAMKNETRKQKMIFFRVLEMKTRRRF